MSDWTTRLIVIAVCAAPVIADAPAYPEPPARPDDAYVERLRAFFDATDDAALRRRALLDLYVAGSVLRRSAVTDHARTRLLLDHPVSTQAKYMLTTFKDASTYRDFVKQITSADPASLAGDGAKPYWLVVRLGLNTYGPALFSDHAFALRAAMLADQAGEADARDKLIGKFHQENEDADLDAVADAVFGPNRATAQRIIDLQLTDHRLAGFCQRVLIGSLDDATRRSPAMARIAIVNAIQDGDRLEALRLIDALAADGDADRLLYWKAGCQIGLNDDLAALATIQQLVQAHGPSAAAATMRRVLPWIERRQELSTALNRVAGRAVTYAKRGVGAFELRFKGEIARAETGVYFAMRPSGEFVELFVHRGGKHVLAYRSTDGETRIWFDGEDHVHVYTGGIILPVPRVTIEEDDEGGFNLGMSMQVGGAVAAVTEANRGLFNSPLLNTPAGRLRLMGSLGRLGIAPTAVTTDDDGVSIIDAVRFDRVEPSAKNVRLVVDAAGQLTRIEHPDGRVTLRYGSDAATAFKPPAWPDLPVRTFDNMADAMVLFGRVIARAQEVTRGHDDPADSPGDDPPTP